MGRSRALLTSAPSRRPSRPPPSAHARSPPARRPRRSGFPNQRPGPAPPPGGGGGRVVLAAAPAAAEPAESQRLTCARCGGPTDRLATGRKGRRAGGRGRRLRVRGGLGAEGRLGAAGSKEAEGPGGPGPGPAAAAAAAAATLLLSASEEADLPAASRAASALRLEGVSGAGAAPPFLVFGSWLGGYCCRVRARPPPE
ncbi:hypothetical protein J1605_001934 [Eschrichtius robustus]|uniref:Uncharacterized protein n=1 Tax=Eschrichtius robustus TaxID=9764 RepID=A0AB34I0T4_ESCRO|nr:hypothetical protein J1605_001934 [Eschrichtius robustus]